MTINRNASKADDPRQSQKGKRERVYGVGGGRDPKRQAAQATHDRASFDPRGRGAPNGAMDVCNNVSSTRCRRRGSRCVGLSAHSPVIFRHLRAPAASLPLWHSIRPPASCPRCAARRLPAAIGSRAPLISLILVSPQLRSLRAQIPHTEAQAQRQHSAPRRRRCAPALSSLATTRSLASLASEPHALWPTRRARQWLHLFHVSAPCHPCLPSPIDIDVACPSATVCLRLSTAMLSRAASISAAALLPRRAYAYPSHREVIFRLSKDVRFLPTVRIT